MSSPKLTDDEDRLPQVGDRVWTISNEGSKSKYKVSFIHESSTVKRGSKNVYTLVDVKTGQEIKTRLMHLTWGYSKKKNKEGNNDDVIERTESNDANMGKREKGNKRAKVCAETFPTTSRSKPLPLPSHRLILAPMVGGSELAFRLLCRKYGADLCYTPMMSSVMFASDASYRKKEFQTTPEDHPVVAHFSANDPQVRITTRPLYH
jgi:hypothetical protein